MCFLLKVLVENGTKEGHQILMEARDTLLKVLKYSRLDSTWKSTCGICFSCYCVTYLTQLLEIDKWLLVFSIFRNRRRLSMTLDQHPCLLRYVKIPAGLKYHAKSLTISFSVFLYFPVFGFSQCPHEQMCPKLAVEPITPCNFQQLYQPLPLPGVRFNSGLQDCIFFINV